MKNCVVLVFLFANLLSAQDNVRLSGKITNPTGKKCYISFVRMLVDNNDEVTGTEDVLDSVDLDNEGNFKFVFDINRSAIVDFDDGNEHTSLVVEKGDDLYLTLNTLMFDETILYSGKGSEKNNALKNVYLIHESIMDEVYGSKFQNDTTELFGYIDSSCKSLDNVVKGYQNQYPSTMSFLDQYANNGDRLKSQIRSQKAFDKLVSELKGKEFNNFEGVSLDGKKVKLSDYKGRILVLDFWATWCGPCKMEMPFLKEQEVKLGEKMDFLSVCIWSKESDWTTMAKNFGLKNNVFVSKDQMDQFKDYQMNFVPRYIVLDENLRILSADASRPSQDLWRKEFLK
jgi:thiol-disulfide isomerase/thioredoxin